MEIAIGPAAGHTPVMVMGEAGRFAPAFAVGLMAAALSCSDDGGSAGGGTAIPTGGSGGAGVGGSAAQGGASSTTGGASSGGTNVGGTSAGASAGNGGGGAQGGAAAGGSAPAGGTGATGQGGTGPADCSAIEANSEWELCESGVGTCKAVFRDSAGCAALCATVGMVCDQVFEDIDDQCAPDQARPELACSGSGHQSDYCVCVSGGGSGGAGGSGAGGSGAAGGAGGTSSVGEDCNSYPFKTSTLLAELEGFGEETTGGDPNNVYRVTNLNESGSGSLRAALESSDDYWIVFDVSGTISHPSNPRIQVASNKTIDGRGRDITIEGNLYLRDVTNVIISDVKVTNDLEGHCTQDGDVITLLGNGTSPDSYSTRNVWVHHVEGFNGGDGVLDLRGASKVTISWSHFHTHKKLMLFADNQDGSPATGMRVTLHHNFFDRISLRGPLLRYGWAHYFNNYQFEWYEVGMMATAGSQAFSEKNVFEAREGAICLPACPDPNPCGDSDFDVSKEGLVTDWAADGPGNAKSVGDLMLDGALVEERNPDQVFDPSDHYSYLADIASTALADIVRNGAGPRTTYCQ